MTGRLRLCAHLGYLFTEMPLELRFAAAAAAGFEVVEHPSPYSLSAQRVSALCRTNGLRLAQIALPSGGPDRKGLAALTGMEEAFRSTLVEGIAYAVASGCQLIHPMAGVPDKDESAEHTWQVYLENISLACDAAAEAGLTVIIEPIGAATLPGYYVDHPEIAVRTLDVLGASNLMLSFDAFHAARAGVDPVTFVERHAARIAHVQIADAPGRHEPGTGEIDFSRFFDALIAADYRGAVGLEYHPRTDTVSGLDWVERYPAVIPLKM